LDISPHYASTCRFFYLLKPMPKWTTTWLFLQTAIGYSLVYGGVRVVATRSLPWLRSSIVIYQQPRPGLALPKGQHYVTIGWKQAICSLECYDRQLIASTFSLDLGGIQDIQETPLYFYLSLFILPARRCELNMLSSVFIFSYNSDRASTPLARWFLFVRMTSLASLFCKIRTSASLRLSLQRWAPLASGIYRDIWRSALRRWCVKLIQYNWGGELISTI